MEMADVVKDSRLESVQLRAGDSVDRRDTEFEAAPTKLQMRNTTP